MVGRAFAIVLAGCLLLAPAGAAATETPPVQHWLLVSDVHFDPFGSPRLVQRLRAAPAERWRGIFASAGPAPFSGYGSDTNDALLESALEGMASDARDAEVVIVAGDFLAHDFRQKFQAATALHDDASYEAFVDKTIAFLGGEFHAAFPRAHLIPVIGNNDSYCGDYASTPHAAFLAHMAQAWVAGVAPPVADAWIAQFSNDGYYTLPLPLAGARAIVLNDIVWSPKYANRCGAVGSDPGGDELTWLRARLAPSSPARPQWVIAHLPPGVDAFSSLTRTDHGVTMMLAPPYNDQLVALLGDPRADVAMAVAGHTHMNAFRVIGPDASTPVTPMLLVPSISPAFNNNPSFVVADIDTATARVTDERVFVLDDLAALAKNGKRPARWRREYDFTSVFGHGDLDAAHFDGVERAIFDNTRVRMRFEQYYDGESGRAAITEQTWRAYWCSNVALTALSYAACAMPQIQRDLPQQPTAPPFTPGPAPTPGRP